MALSCSSPFPFLTPAECSSYCSNPRFASRGHPLPTAPHQPRCNLRLLSEHMVKAHFTHVLSTECSLRSVTTGCPCSQWNSVPHPAAPTAPPAAANAAWWRAGTCHTAGTPDEKLESNMLRSLRSCDYYYVAI